MLSEAKKIARFLQQQMGATGTVQRFAGTLVNGILGESQRWYYVLIPQPRQAVGSAAGGGLEPVRLTLTWLREPSGNGVETRLGYATAPLDGSPCVLHANTFQPSEMGDNEVYFIGYRFRLPKVYQDMLDDAGRPEDL
ncbi:hypothetical protein F0P96_04445 [Hymenobacter busanensis]|uniref:Uncharacterized protein n=1 Tax=Hymenobacter busanensis TaxID=2607656 RepID=A0A7L4ZTU9_9BACT|nr:hypothetical protein [Hymenobacter busanensis]KAA9339872.1 hypothetical protein F0P96_04445 [Hymenobacter busanensis]QHJ06373.1 hypothetical protein GUY19_03290 [Hymenobacter busanensis]